MPYIMSGYIYPDEKPTLFRIIGQPIEFGKYDFETLDEAQATAASYLAEKSPDSKMVWKLEDGNFKGIARYVDAMDKKWRLIFTIGQVVATRMLVVVLTNGEEIKLEVEYDLQAVSLVRNEYLVVKATGNMGYTFRWASVAYFYIERMPGDSGSPSDS